MYDERELLRGNTPTLVLAVLRNGPQHGYGIAREINQRTNNMLKFRQGTLYPTLHALEREGLVAGQWETTGERPRLVYTITEAGQAELDRRMRIWNQFSLAMSQVIGAKPDEQPA